MLAIMLHCLKRRWALASGEFVPQLILIIEWANYRTNISAGAFEMLQQSIVCSKNWPSCDNNSEIQQVR